MHGFQKIDSVYQKGVYQFDIGFEKIVSFYNYKTVATLITSSENITKAKQYRFAWPWLGQGLLTSTGDHWKRNRKMLTPAFHFKVLESFVPVMNENVKIMLNKIDASVGSAEMNQNGIDVRWLLTDCTMGTICETAMGMRVVAQGSPDQRDYIQQINTVLNLLIRRSVEPLHQFDWTYKLTPEYYSNKRALKKIHSFVRKVCFIRILVF